MFWNSLLSIVLTNSLVLHSIIPTDALAGLHSPRPEFVYEHIAGPNCQDYQGYNGNLISAEEMRGCNTSQCLMWKDKDWQAEPDDMEFELSSHCFLTGISDYMPLRDVGGLIVIPARHGEESPWADNVTWDVCLSPFTFVRLKE